MNTFKIFFKDITVLKIGDVKKTFAADTMYGFKFVSDKELNNIKKQIIGNSDINFYLTDDLTGCYQVIYGNKKPKDVSTENLVTLNKGKKNKNGIKYATRSTIKENLKDANEEADKNVETIVPPIEGDNIIADENKKEG